MKTRSTPNRCTALTLIELLVIIAIIAVLAAVLLPAHTVPRQRALTVVCLNNQKQIALGYTLWSGDNQTNFPMQVSVTNNGTRELIPDGLVGEQFSAVTNYLPNINVLFCPADPRYCAGLPSNSQAGLSNQNISYFLNIDATPDNEKAVLTGDRNLTGLGLDERAGIYPLTTNALSWTRAIHSHRGNFSFPDGHAEMVPNERLPAVMAATVAGTNRLMMP